MPNEEKITYKVGQEVYDIPLSEQNDFLNEFKDAVQVKSFVSGKDTFDIPIDEVENFLKDVPDAKPFDVGKPLTAPLPGDGGGLSSGMTPGVDGGKPELDIQKELFKGAGVPEIPEGVIKSTITPAEYQLFVGKGEEPTITTGKGYKEAPTALEKEIKPDLNFERFKYTDKLVLNPFPNLAERLKNIDEYGVDDVKKMEKAKVFDDLIRYKNEQTKDYNAEFKLLNQNLQQSIQKANEIATQLSNPEIPPQDRNILLDQAEKIQFDIANLENRSNDLQSLYNDNKKMLNTLTTARKSMQFNYNNALELGAMGLFNATVPSLMKGLGDLFEFTTGIPKDIAPDEYKDILEKNPVRVLGQFLKIGADAIELKIDSEINTDLQKELTDDINSRNAALFLGQVLGSFATTMATGGYGAAVQSFGSAYDYAKEVNKDISDSQAGFFALPIAVVGGFLAPYGTEKFTKLLTSNSGKEALKKAIDLMKSNPNASYNKTLDIAKEWAKSVVQEAAEEGAETATQELSKAAFTELYDKDLYAFGEGKDIKSIVKRISYGLYEGGAGSIVLSTLVAPFGGLQYGNLSNIVAKGVSNPQEEIDFANNIESLYDGGQINEQIYQEITNLFQKAKQTVNQIPKDIKDESAISRSVQLIMAQQEIEEQLKTVNPAMSGDLKAKLDKINEELGRIAGGEIPQAAPDLDAVTQGKVPATEPAPTEAVPVEEVKAEVTVAEPLKDFESTAKALEGVDTTKLGYVKYEDAITIEPQVDFENLPKGVDEISREARSQAIREQENKPPKYKKYTTGTRAVDRFGEVYELREVPLDEAISKQEGTQREATIDKYVEWIKQGNEMPPAKGVENFAVEGGKIKIIDGNHRYQAAKKAGLETIPVWVALTDKKNTARPIYAKNEISEAYHADKAAGKETELTKAVEELLAKPTEAAVAPEAAPTETAAQPTLEDFDVINMTSVKGRKAREELKARVGMDAYKKMDMVNKKFNDVIKDLEDKGILRKECP